MCAATHEQVSATLFSRASIEDPFPLYARLRRELPISRVDETGVHLVATWNLIEEVLGREADFSANLTGVLIRDEAGKADTCSFPDRGANHVIATADEPDHAVHRALVQPRLAAKRVASLEETVRAWACEALDAWLGEGAGDFVPTAEAIPVRVVARLLGLPDGDVSRHRAWAMVGGDFLAGAITKAQLIKLASETSEMAEYLSAHLDRIGSAGADDPESPMLCALARGVEHGAIDRAQAVGIAIVMFGAGGESTAALIGSSVRRLAADTAIQHALRGAPELIPRFVEEVARLEPPFKFHYRGVRRRCELGGVTLEAGERLMLLWASANRDVAVFEDPDTLRLDRRHPKHHMGFGRGNHFCIGAPVARLETRVVIEELLARTKHFALRADDPPGHTASIFVRRLERLPLEIVST